MKGNILICFNIQSKRDWVTIRFSLTEHIVFLLSSVLLIIIMAGYTKLQASWSDSCILNKQQPPFGAKVCRDTWPQTWSVPRGKQFSESQVQGEVRASRNRSCPRTNTCAYSRTKRRCYVSCALDIFNEWKQIFKINIFCNAQYKLFTNSLLFTAPTFTFRLSFMKFYLVLWNLWTNRYVASPATTAKPFLILN